MKLYQKIAQLIDARARCEKSCRIEWFKKHDAELSRLQSDSLPSGAGIDNGTKIDLAKSTGEKIVLLVEYHAMDEHGFYIGWRNYTVKVTPSFVSDFCIDVTGRGPSSDKDYLAETFQQILSEECDETWYPVLSLVNQK